MIRRHDTIHRSPSSRRRGAGDAGAREGVQRNRSFRLPTRSRQRVRGRRHDVVHKGSISEVNNVKQMSVISDVLLSTYLLVAGEDVEICGGCEHGAGAECS